MNCYHYTPSVLFCQTGNSLLCDQFSSFNACLFNKLLQLFKGDAGRVLVVGVQCPRSYLEHLCKLFLRDTVDVLKLADIAPYYYI